MWRETFFTCLHWPTPASSFPFFASCLLSSRLSLSLYPFPPLLTLQIKVAWVCLLFDVQAWGLVSVEHRPRRKPTKLPKNLFGFWAEVLLLLLFLLSLLGLYMGPTKMRIPCEPATTYLQASSIPGHVFFSFRHLGIMTGDWVCSYFDV